MGNRTSVFMRKETEVDWDAYVAEDWRSQRSRDLDRYGGLDRDTVKRGDSMTAQLSFLEVSCRNTGQDIEKALHKNPIKRPVDQKKKMRNGEDTSSMLRTEIRAIQRSSAYVYHGGDDEDDTAKDASSKPLSWAEAQERDRLSKLAARKKALEYGRSVRNIQAAGPSLIPITAPVAAPAPVVLAVADPKDAKEVAAWRLRIHAARRRCILVVLTVVRLRRGFNHPSRMQRVDSFAFYIPIVLGEDYGRFLEEQGRHKEISSLLATYQAAIHEAEAAIEGLKEGGEGGGGGGGGGSTRTSASGTAGCITRSQGHHGGSKAGGLGGGGGSGAAPSKRKSSGGTAPSSTSAVTLPLPSPLGSSAIAAAISRPREPLTLSEHDMSSVRVGGDGGGGGGAGSISADSRSSGSPARQLQSLPALKLDAPVSAPPVSLPLVKSLSNSEATTHSSPSPALRGGGDRLVGSTALRPGSSRALLQLPRSPSKRTSNPSQASSSPLPPWERSSESSTGHNLQGGGPPLLKRGGPGGLSKRMPSWNPAAAAAVSATLAAEKARLADLHHRMDLEMYRLQKCELMLAMYATRANGSFAERHNGWSPAHAIGPEDQHQFHSSESFMVHRADLIRKLRAGQVVFQMLAAEDEIRLTVQQQSVEPPPSSTTPTSPTGRFQPIDLPPTTDTSGVSDICLDLWTKDPWSIVSSARPGSMPIDGSERLEGLSLGGRVLTQLRSSVEAVAGKDAVDNLKVVVHLHEGQVQEALAEVWNRGWFGLQKGNLLFTVSRRESGYKFDPSVRQFVSLEDGDHDSHRQQSLGPGYSLLQLAWVSDAFTLGEAGPGVRVPLKGTLLEHLLKTKAEWMVSRRMRDLCLLTSGHREGGGALDLRSLCQAVHLREHQRATMVTQAARTTNQSYARALDSILMCVNHGRDRGPLPSHHHHHHHSSRSGAGGLVPSSSPGSPPSPAAAPHLQHHQYSSSAVAKSVFYQQSRRGGPAPPVMELRCCEISSKGMVDALARVRVEASGESLVGLHRYDFHLPSLAEALSHINVMRPKLLLDGATVHVSLEMSDVTSDPRSRCMAILAQDPAPMILTTKEVDDMIPFLIEQDANPAFRRAAGLVQLPPRRTLDSLSLQLHMGSRPGTTSSSDRGSSSSSSSRALRPSLSGQTTPNLSFPSSTHGPRQRLVVLCLGNEVSKVAVEAAGRVAKAGRDEVVLMTAVNSELQQDKGRELLQGLQRLVLGPRQLEARLDVIVRGHSGLIECLETYLSTVKATMVYMGSQAVTSLHNIPSFSSPSLTPSSPFSSSASRVASARAGGMGAGGGGGGSGGLMGSVTLSLAKRLSGLPLVIVTANTRFANNTASRSGAGGERSSLNARSSFGEGGGGGGGSRVGSTTRGGGGGGAGTEEEDDAGGLLVSTKGKAPRILLLVEPHAKPMLQHLCNTCLDPLRGDKIFLAQLFPSRLLTTQQQQQAKRLVDALADFTAGKHLTPHKLEVDGDPRALLGCIEELGAQLLALALKPEEKGLPDHVLGLIRSSKAPVLIYR